MKISQYPAAVASAITNAFKFVMENPDQQTYSIIASELKEYFQNGVVPENRTINGKTLQQNIFLTPNDIGAASMVALKEVEDKILATYPEANAGPAAIVNVDDGANGIPVKSLFVTVEPQQDLNGYEKPWPAGGGKNLLKNTSVSWTEPYRGITATVNNDGTVTFNGTATQQVDFDINASFAGASAAAIMSGCPSGGSSSTYRLQMAGGYNDSGNGVSIPANTSGRVYFRIYGGVTVNNLVVKPMIRLATETDAAFEPYSNICPISGWDMVKVMHTGANAWDEKWEVGNYSSTTGEKTSANTRIRCKNLIPVKPSTAYYFAAPSGTRNQWFEYGADGSFLGAHDFEGGNFTVGANTHFITFTMTQVYGTSYNNDISINYPATDTDYHAYQGESMIIQLGQTVYGGTLDVATRELMIDRQMLNYTGAASEMWEFYNIGTTSAEAMMRLGADRIYVSDSSTSGLVSLCDKLPTAVITSSGTSVGIRIYYSTSPEFSGGQQLLVVRPMDAISIANAAAFKAWLQGIGGLTLCVKLINPITVQLSPQEVTTLLGVNNIWADAGDTTLTYRQDISIVIGKLLAAQG